MIDYNFDIINKKSYYGHAFDITDKKRLKKFQEQRLSRGFDETELYSLDLTTLEFFTPRFKAYKKNLVGYPSKLFLLGDKIGFKVWEKILNRIEKSLDWKMDQDNFHKVMPKDIEIGFKFLVRYFTNLWD